LLTKHGSYLRPSLPSPGYFESLRNAAPKRVRTSPDRLCEQSADDIYRCSIPIRPRCLPPPEYFDRRDKNPAKRTDRPELLAQGTADFGFATTGGLRCHRTSQRRLTSPNRSEGLGDASSTSSEAFNVTDDDATEPLGLEGGECVPPSRGVEPIKLTTKRRDSVYFTPSEGQGDASSTSTEAFIVTDDDATELLVHEGGEWVPPSRGVEPIKLTTKRSDSVCFTPETFRDYFGQSPELMRALLTQYAPRASLQDLANLPCYHSGVRFPDEQIKKAFFDTFDSDSFALHENSLVAVDDELENLLSHCPSLIRESEDRLRRMTEYLKAIKRRHNAACKARKTQCELCADPIVRAENVVYHCIRSSVSHQLSNDGSDTNAELTRASARKLIDSLTAEGILHKDTVFLDGGAAYNVFASHVAQVVGCRVWGIEYVPERCYLAVTNFLNALQNESLLNPKIAFAPLDLFAVQDYGPTSVAYFFDEAFPVALLEHCMNCARNTKGLKYVISYKASKRPSVHKAWAEYGWEK